MLLYYSFFSPRQVKNKPCDGIMKLAFTHGPNSLVANSWFSCLFREKSLSRNLGIVIFFNN